MFPTCRFFLIGIFVPLKSKTSKLVPWKQNNTTSLQRMMATAAAVYFLLIVPSFKAAAPPSVPKCISV